MLGSREKLQVAIISIHSLVFLVNVAGSIVRGGVRPWKFIWILSAMICISAIVAAAVQLHIDLVEPNLPEYSNFQEVRKLQDMWTGTGDGWMTAGDMPSFRILGSREKARSLWNTNDHRYDLHMKIAELFSTLTSFGLLFTLKTILLYDPRPVMLDRLLGGLVSLLYTSGLMFDAVNLWFEPTTSKQHVSTHKIHTHAHAHTHTHMHTHMHTHADMKLHRMSEVGTWIFIICLVCIALFAVRRMVWANEPGVTMSQELEPLRAWKIGFFSVIPIAIKFGHDITRHINSDEPPTPTLWDYRLDRNTQDHKGILTWAFCNYAMIMLALVAWAFAGWLSPEKFSNEPFPGGQPLIPPDPAAQPGPPMQFQQGQAMQLQPTAQEPPPPV